MSNESLQIIPIIKDSEQIIKTLDFLYIYEPFCMYLIGNLEKFGPVSTDHPYSGNFYMITKQDSTVGIFCACNSGLIIAYISQNSVSDQLFDDILTKLLMENIKISGIIAEENTAQHFLSSLFRRFGERLKILTDSHNELLKIADIKEKYNDFSSKNDSNDQVRFLRLEDYSSWHELMRKFQEETQMAFDPEEMQVRVFENEVGLKHIWGYFKEIELISIVRLNSCTKQSGCFGGIYTKLGFRGRGAAKTLINQALSDCAKIHNHAYNILFTSETNTKALNLYYSIGYLKIGQIKICFFETK